MRRAFEPWRLAAVAAAVSIGCVVGGLWIELAARSADRPVQPRVLSDLVVAVLFPITAVIVLRHDRRNRVGWVLASCSLVGVSVLAHQWAYDAGVARPGYLPLGGLATWLAAWTFWPYWLQPTLLPVLFPRGDPPSRGWRRFTGAVVIVAAVGVLATMFKADDDVEGMGLSNPLGLEILGWPMAGLLQPLSVAVLALFATPIAVGGLARRQRRCTGVERAQLQWLLLGFTGCFALGVVSALLGDRGDILFGLAFALIPLTIAIAIVRHGLFDIEIAVNRTVVYVILSAGSAVGFLAIVGLTSHYVTANGAGAVAAAIVASFAVAGHNRLQRLVDRRLFGARKDPMAVVERVAASTQSAAQPLDALVATVRTALRIPFVQILDEGGDAMASSGAPAVGTHVFPIVDRGRRFGTLVVGRRTRRERLRRKEESALREVATRAGSLMHAAALASDLQRAYERTTVAREEERRRLRRDLHDGIGPALAGMALQLDSLSSRLSNEPALANRAAVLRDRLRDTVGEVRRIVDGLRPAAIDELGLSGALRALAMDEDAPVTLTVDTDLPERLPAAAEVATYRIAAEAVANVLRHADATAAAVTAHLDSLGNLQLTVADNGRGFGADTVAGVGLRSLHERAEEVGGTLSVVSEIGIGTTVTAVLPVGA